MLHVSAFMLGHHQTYKNVETWLMNCHSTRIPDIYIYTTGCILLWLPQKSIDNEKMTVAQKIDTLSAICGSVIIGP
jgi:hypothetical protein